jgi:hypothetical protein
MTLVKFSHRFKVFPEIPGIIPDQKHGYPPRMAAIVYVGRVTPSSQKAERFSQNHQYRQRISTSTCFERRKGRCRTQGVTMKITAFQAKMAGVPPAGRCYRVYIALSGKNNL